MDAQQFKQAMRHCAGAVAVVTVGMAPGRRAGLTVTSVCSLSDEPPSVLVCVNRRSATYACLRRERCFAVNFLAQEHVELALVFSGQGGLTGDARFNSGRWRHDGTGAPVLEDAQASFDCDLREEIPTRTHSIFIGEVRHARFLNAARPLAYLRGAFHDLRPYAAATARAPGPPSP